MTPPNTPRRPRRLRRGVWVGAGALIVLLVVLAGSAAMAERVEEPSFVLVKKAGDVELRRYAPTVRAVTTVRGLAWDQSTSEGFRRLAGYIFGGNATRGAIAMTSPVTAAPAPSTRIAMTAPVTAADGADGVQVTFTMPAGSTLKNLPVPNDRGVTLVEVPERLVAVLRFTGFASDETFARKRAELLSALPALGFAPAAEVELARYDPPWTVPFLRRNEATVAVVPKP